MFFRVITAQGLNKNTHTPQSSKSNSVYIFYRIVVFIRAELIFFTFMAVPEPINPRTIINLLSELDIKFF